MKKVDSSVLAMDCHALPCKARNDRESRFFIQDSRSCGGALQALKNLGKVSDLVGRAFHKFFKACQIAHPRPNLKE